VAGIGDPGIDRPFSGVIERPSGVKDPRGETGPAFETADLASD
jgi:hypothetical protein